MTPGERAARHLLANFSGSWLALSCISHAGVDWFALRGSSALLSSGEEAVFMLADTLGHGGQPTERVLAAYLDACDHRHRVLIREALAMTMEPA